MDHSGWSAANRTVNGFAVDAGNPKTMYIAMRDGLFRSTDAGASWKVIGKELKNLASVATTPKRPAEVFVSTTDGTIYVSADSGTKWAKH